MIGYAENGRECACVTAMVDADVQLGADGPSHEFQHCWDSCEMQLSHEIHCSKALHAHSQQLHSANGADRSDSSDL